MKNHVVILISSLFFPASVFSSVKQETILNKVVFDNSAVSNELSFVLPENMVNFSFVVSGDQNKKYEIISLINPEGEDIIEKNRAYRSYALATILVPSNKSADMQGGTWKLRVSAFDENNETSPISAELDSAIYFKAGDKRPEGGRLVLNIHVPSESMHKGVFSNYPELDSYS